MKKNSLIGCLLFFSSCFALQNNQAVYRVVKTQPDTAVIYSLPYAAGTAHRIWQGYHSLFSHFGNFALDFKMDPGTAIHAARGGVVVVVKESSKKGGLRYRFVNTENGIVVQHSDGSFAHYLHIQHQGALVSVGDTVKRGQKIGWSGSTGFSAFPHLHFEVTPTLQKGKNEIPVRFYTQQGPLFLQPLRSYKKPANEMVKHSS